MNHPLVIQYGVAVNDLLDAISKRFRLKVALEGAVAEIQMEKHIAALVGTAIHRYETFDEDGRTDFGIWLPEAERPILAECKNVRDRDQAYRRRGAIVAYKVETQKTRASKGDPSSRFYDVDQFGIIGVCLGKKTGDWSDFRFARTADLARHASHPNKLAVFQRVPLPGEATAPWYNHLVDLLTSWEHRSTEPS